MGPVALKVKAIARMKLKKTFAVQNDFQTATQDVNELLTHMLVGTFAGGAGCELKTVAFHLQITGSQYLHRDT